MNNREKRGVVSPAASIRAGSNQPCRNGAHKTVLIKQSMPSCPECGGRLIRMGYCFPCVNCGWGGCS